MKYLIIIFVLSVSVLIASKLSDSAPKITDPIESIYELEAVSISGDSIRLSEYKGKKIIIVNVASKCGYTSQYEGLQDLHEKYSEEVVVLGFPSNDFLWQEPGSNNDIAEFCSSKYGVSFPMFQKVKVRGGNKHPIYQWLSSKSKNGWNNKAPSWNFSKYIVDESGRLIGRFGPKVTPTSSEIIQLIEQ